MSRFLTVMLLTLTALPLSIQAETTPEARLKAAGYELPPPTAPVAAYVTWRRSGNLLYLSGHGECGKDFTRGKVGNELTLEQGRQVAERVGLCMLATIKSAVKSKAVPAYRRDGECQRRFRHAA